MTSTTIPSVAIVGGGIAGLTSAIHAAREGAAVTLFERASDAGGRARSQVEHGFTLNLGPHALYPGAERELRSLGVELSGRVPAASGHALAGGRLSLLPAGAGSAVRTRLLSPRQKVEFAKVFRELSTVDPSTWDGRPLDEWIATATRPGRGRQLVETYMRLSTYANAPHLLDAGATLRNLQSALPGVRYLDGGWGRMVERLRAAAVDAGVTIHTGQRIDRVEANGPGFTLRGPGMHAFEASSVVLAVAPATAAAMLESAAPADARRALHDTRPARAATLDIGLRALPKPNRTFVLGVDTPVYIQCHSMYADLAPPGTVLLSAAMYLPVGEEPAAEQARATLEGALDRFQPGWRDERITERFLPSLTVTEGIPQWRQPRPAEDAPWVPGIYLAGDWVGSEGFLAEAALVSARRAAGLAAAHAWRHTGEPVAVA